MKSHRLLNTRVVAIAAGAVLAAASGAANALETTFIGYTDGCFAVSPATACSPTANPADQSTTLAGSGLTFTDSNFNVTTAGGFVSIGTAPASPDRNNLGSFALSNAPFVYNGQHFDLLASFTAPPGTTPGQVLFTDLLTGTVDATGGGVFLDFDNTPKHFTFGSGSSAGSFDFFVNDLSVVHGGNVAVTGTITSQVSAVPEPETYALFMAGLA
ncbi:MAG: hypothetical protein M3R22_09040, partial [Pseudomonadota bacterium]|nr:hypothetical protein [Pseudomonadota bacterium]